ncbi:hypothetical protein [Prosthecomicrobium hirschii]|uniref:Beta/gamma crystallin 'Greek key' domain-containing protein n=1 Tax=Prosthecodimorpha hirschii TaxID=665126 RepID=A0A0P6VIK7_9HYPH|nr:hypothetical protein [Prosthecomicrobium hirschii]KPL51930.1 hypothetical protein ABB55_06565 [Prosthecomicrobium hirschii]MCW1843719.1 SUEL-type lectin domain-containing protein [Prosthecomicrobium hirschii]TPQ49585.1 hypothetical protein C2U72_17720 [Prosthecomicrobium hirschii]
MLLRSLATAAAVILGTHGLVGTASAMGNDPDQNVIRVTSATYGASCRVAPGNATYDVAARCNGLPFCNYKVSYKVLGDPAYGCKKDFQVRYQCGRRGPFQASAPGEAGYGTPVALICK